ncbi:MAG TPA: alpha/beta fold hydrolase [Acidimicrobiales bacterium]|nr:alpha/beta fold hydrolase [Acidimicrobiales bacterium]
MTAAPSPDRADGLPGDDQEHLRLPDADLTLPPGTATEVGTDDGATLSITVHGASSSTMPPVVLPHCWTGSRIVGVPVARRLLAAGHRVVLYDQRGHGSSTLGRDTVTVDRLGADLVAVVRHLDLGDLVLAGHSMGGMTVMAFACQHLELVRERVRGLALIATAGHGLAERWRSRLLRRAILGGLADLTMRHPRAGYAAVRSTFGADPERAHVEATRALFMATPAPVVRDCIDAMGAMDLRQVLRAVDVPTTVLLGRRDQLVANALTRAIVDHIAGAELIELPGAGHMLPLERPDEVAAAIRALAA